MALPALLVLLVPAAAARRPPIPPLLPQLVPPPSGLCPYCPPPMTPILQVLYAHGGSEHEVRQLRSAEEAGLVCDALTSKPLFAEGALCEGGGGRAMLQLPACTWAPDSLQCNGPTPGQQSKQQL